MAKDKKIDADIIAALPDDSASTQKFLRSEGLSTLDSVSSVPLTAFNVLGTPTAILVNSNGQVLKVWVGLLSKNREESLVSSIEAKPTLSVR